MAKLTETMITLIELKTNCGVSEHDDYYSIYVDNRYCQDFTLEIDKSDNEVEDIITQCENYDPEDEFKCWYGANNGEPSSPQSLLDNCNEIGDNLDELARLLRDYDFETFDKIKEETNASLSDAEIDELVEQGYSEVCAIYQDKDEMAYEEAQSLLGINETVMNYFKYDEFGDDLLESDHYYKLKSGRIVAAE